MSRTVVCGLDIETTGLSQPEGHRIIEVAAIVYDLATEKEAGRYAVRINPERGIDAGAQAVHGIAYEDLIGCPTWETVAPKLSKLMSACDYVVAHNGIGFDMPFIYGEFIRAGVALPEVAVVDTMLQGRWATADGAVPNLGLLAYASDVAYDKTKAHAAIYDVEVMMSCFFKHWKSDFFKLEGSVYKYTVPKIKEKK
jgi:DNA polymerase-3 subunit epsilon